MKFLRKNIHNALHHILSPYVISKGFTMVMQSPHTQESKIRLNCLFLKTAVDKKIRVF